MYEKNLEKKTIQGWWKDHDNVHIAYAYKFVYK